MLISFVSLWWSSEFYKARIIYVHAHPEEQTEDPAEVIKFFRQLMSEARKQLLEYTESVNMIPGSGLMSAVAKTAVDSYICKTSGHSCKSPEQLAIQIYLDEFTFEKNVYCYVEFFLQIYQRIMALIFKYLMPTTPGMQTEEPIPQAYGFGDPLEDAYIDVTDIQFQTITEGNRAAQQMMYYDENGKQFPSFEEAKAYFRTYTDPPKRNEAKKWYQTGLDAFNSKGLVKPFILRVTSRNLFHAFHSRQVGVKSIETRAARRLYERFARKMVAKWVKKIKMYWEMHGLITEEDYISEMPPKKQNIYRAGLELYNKTGTVPVVLEMRQKSNEAHYDHFDKIRGRLFFNPTGQAKIIAGCYNKNVIVACKSFLPQFVHGLDCAELETRIESLWKEVSNPCFGDADGSSHDAHEHQWKIDVVDNALHKALVAEYGARLGYDTLKTAALMANVTCSIRPFFAYYVGTRNVMMKGVLVGTVNSGASTLTTLGNTLRIIVCQQLIKKFGNFMENELQYLQSGDDQLQVVTESKKDHYNWISSVLYNSTEQMGGIGYLVKVQNWTGNIFSFLSKTGGASHDRVSAHRMWHRAIIGGNQCHKITRRFTPAHHVWAVNSQLASWVGDLGVMNSYLNERRVKLPQVVPTKRQVQWMHEEEFYKMVSHANPHAQPGHFEHLTPFLYQSTYSIFSQYSNSHVFYDMLEGLKYC